MPYGITQCYLPTGSSDFPAFTPPKAGTWFGAVLSWGERDNSHPAKKLCHATPHVTWNTDELKASAYRRKKGVLWPSKYFSGRALLGKLMTLPQTPSWLGGHPSPHRRLDMGHCPPKHLPRTSRAWTVWISAWCKLIYAKFLIIVSFLQRSVYI